MARKDRMPRSRRAVRTLDGKEIPSAFVRSAHREHRQVLAWTVDDPSAMERLADLAVDNIITNVPDTTQEVLSHYRRLGPVERAVRRIRTWVAE